MKNEAPCSHREKLRPSGQGNASLDTADLENTAAQGLRSEHGAMKNDTGMRGAKLLLNGFAKTSD